MFPSRCPQLHDALHVLGTDHDQCMEYSMPALFTDHMATVHVSKSCCDLPTQQRLVIFSKVLTKDPVRTRMVLAIS